ncbi:MAG: hypothetical protein RIS35_410 [Pseudomonadota bacterium]|jgi:hypothetical protein
MQRTPVRGGKLKSAGYDRRAQLLEVEFVDGAMRHYQGVPEEVWRRLISAPNPGSFFEDRVADEYPNRPASADTPVETRSRLDALFGPSPEEG